MDNQIGTIKRQKIEGNYIVTETSLLTVKGNEAPLTETAMKYLHLFSSDDLSKLNRGEPIVNERLEETIDRDAETRERAQENIRKYGPAFYNTR